MVRKYPNPRSGDLGIDIHGVPWFTPPLHILKFFVQNNLEEKNQSEKTLGVSVGGKNSHGTPSILCLNHQILCFVYFLTIFLAHYYNH